MQTPMPSIPRLAPHTPSLGQNVLMLLLVFVSRVFVLHSYFYYAYHL